MILWLIVLALVGDLPSKTVTTHLVLHIDRSSDSQSRHITTHLDPHIDGIDDSQSGHNSPRSPHQRQPMIVSARFSPVESVWPTSPTHPAMPTRNDTLPAHISRSSRDADEKRYATSPNRCASLGSRIRRPLAPATAILQQPLAT
jgi:hypothetical protein